MNDRTDHSNLEIKIHPKEGLIMSISSSPWLKFCAGMAILLCAVSVVILAFVPFISALR
ncbi:hypothetical protein [Cronobacter dublinensis]|uniref:hypothetical protein n=1 Tax=Cronobacter dublinensis TaxID=413497 RepID=UPI00300E34B8